MFILTVTKKNFNLLINEWQPIRFNSLENLPILLLLLFFACTLPFALQRKPFRFFLMLGILYLGVSNFKQNLFMWLFIPYFAAVFFDALPEFTKTGILVRQSTLRGLLAVGLLLNIAYLFLVPPVIDAKNILSMKWTIFYSIHLKVHVPKFSPTTVHPAMSCFEGRCVM